MDCDGLLEVAELVVLELVEMEMVEAVLVMEEVEEEEEKEEVVEVVEVVETPEVVEGVGPERTTRSVAEAERSPAEEVGGLEGGESRVDPGWSPPGRVQAGGGGGGRGRGWGRAGRQ